MSEILRRASRFERVPANKPLFQFVGRELVFSTPGATNSPLVHILPRPNSGSFSRVETTPVTSSSYATSSPNPLFEGFSPLKVNRSSQASFPNNSFEGFSPPRAHRSTRASGGVPDLHFSSQFPDPPNEPLFPFKSRVTTWIDGLVKMGYHRDIAELSTKKDKPSTRRQFESGWKQAEAFFKRHNYKFEDVTAVAFANFLGRQFIDLGLAASTVINHFYACVKPAWFKFRLSLRKTNSF